MSLLRGCISLCSRLLTNNAHHKLVVRWPAVQYSVTGVRWSVTASQAGRGYCTSPDDDSKTNTKMVKVHDVDTSIQYMQSEAYKTTYGSALVWQPYRRNHKGRYPPRKTRKTCIRNGQMSTGNPCPICRDEYLVIDKMNLELLKQFLYPESGRVISYEKTGICQKQHKKLLLEIEKAFDLGLIEKPLPEIKYDYSHYYPGWSS